MREQAWREHEASIHFQYLGSLNIWAGYIVRAPELIDRPLGIGIQTAGDAVRKRKQCPGALLNRPSRLAGSINIDLGTIFEMFRSQGLKFVLTAIPPTSMRA